MGRTETKKDRGEISLSYSTIEIRGIEAITGDNRKRGTKIKTYKGEINRTRLVGQKRTNLFQKKKKQKRTNNDGSLLSEDHFLEADISFIKINWDFVHVCNCFSYSPSN